MIKQIKLALQQYRPLLASVGIVIFFRAFGAGIGFISGVMITRYLGITESGLYFYALDLITTIAVFAGLGLNNTLLRNVSSLNNLPENRVNISIYFWSTVKPVAVVSIISILFIILFRIKISIFLNNSSLVVLLLIFSPLICLIPLQSYLVTFLQSLKKVIQSSLIQFALFYSVLTLMIIFFKPQTAVYTAKLHLIAITISVMTALIFSRKNLFAKGVLKPQKIKGWQSFVVMHLINSVSVILISIINGYFLQPEAFAVLSAANRFTLLISFCLISFNFVAAPKYAKLYHENKHEDLARFSQSVTRLLIAIIIPISLLVFSFNEELMSFYGSEFTEYGYILSILVIGQIVNVATGSVVYLLTLSGHEKDMKNIIAIIIPITVVVSLILAKHFGLTGVAIAMMLSAIATNISAYFMVLKRLGFHALSWQLAPYKGQQ